MEAPEWRHLYNFCAHGWGLLQLFYSMQLPRIQLVFRLGRSLTRESSEIDKHHLQSEFIYTFISKSFIFFVCTEYSYWLLSVIFAQIIEE